ncbi:MAG: ATPase, T2SS/T4P/T4SS family [Thermoguttaceae bacterium]|jgi:type II secretory ATPase GspE/PulE/Tfp pilus assembly ATPase PilB-like protein|nr:ATPase, T2SS/T4P/T4SS family [Thermoguttaceae bacterium]
MKLEKIEKCSRLMRIGAVAAVAFLAGADFVMAGPYDDLAKEATENGWRGGYGMMLCPIKLGILVVFYLAWVATTGWCNNDSEKLGDPDQEKWNGINLIVFVIAFLIALLIPIFWAGLPLVVLGWLVPLFIYVKARNKGMLDADKVMTPSHLIFWFKTKVLRMKVKPKPLKYEGGSPIQLEATGLNVDDQVKMLRTVESRNYNDSNGYNMLRELLYHALYARASEILIEFGADETKFQYQIDGVFHPVYDAVKKPWLREQADEVAYALKKLIGANPDDRRSQQSGIFKLLYDKNNKGKPLTCDATAQTTGTPTGELCKIVFQFKTAPFKNVKEICDDPERQEKLRSVINSPNGLVVLATAPHHGLETLTTVMFNTADRFTRDFSSVEDVQRPYEFIENIMMTTYDSAKGETPMTVLPDVYFKEPKVVLIRDMVNLEGWKLACEEVKNDRLIISTFRAHDSVAAIIALLKYGVPPGDLAGALTAVVAQRLVRRLCNMCKEEIKPDPRVVQQLRLDPATESIFRRRVRVPVEPGQRDYYVPCEDCRDIGFKGRVALLDVLEINDDMRQIIAADASLEKKEQALRQLAVKSDQRGYLIDGARLVQKGVTAYEELVRALSNKTN